MKASYTSSIIYIYIYRYKILPSNHTYIHVCVCLCVCVFMLMPYMLYAVGVKPVGKLSCGARSAQWSSTYTTISLHAVLEALSGAPLILLYTCLTYATIYVS
jgi:hypothetical protein